ncbi:MAG: hypothetical protein ACYC4Q_11355, partial [Victivallaceae bacterium]
MTFVINFFQVNFIPFGILTVAGTICFFSGKFKHEKWYWPLLFIFAILMLVSLWRIPVALTKRHALPTLMPGTVISVFMIMLLPKILSFFHVKYAKAIIRAALAVLLLICAVKTLRKQESKPYLQELPEVIKADMVNNNAGKSVLLVFGDPGGHINVDKSIQLIDIENKYINDKFTNAEYQIPKLIKNLSLDVLNVQYPHIYLLCIENELSVFASAWASKYRNKPDLIYEYARNKNKVNYRLYRVASNCLTAWLPDLEFNKFMRQKNILPNGDFSDKIKLSPDALEMQILSKRGISLFADGDLYIPAGWHINPNSGWSGKSAPAGIKLNKRAGCGNQLAMYSATNISLWNSHKIPADEKYVLGVNVDPSANSVLHVYVCYYNKAGKALRYEDIIAIRPSSKEILPLTTFSLEKFDGYA